MMVAEKSDTQPPAFLSAGFRPFFLFAGLYGVVPVAAWMLAYGGLISLPGPLAPMLWHGHEMVFGFGIAAAAGFLLTAVPNWTGTPPVQGRGLAVLSVLWLAGRIAMWGGGVFDEHWGGLMIAAVDLPLIPALVVIIGRRMAASGNNRNYVFLGLLGILFVANLLMHLEAAEFTEDTAATGLRLGVYGFALLIVLIGGRVIPNFTANALRASGETVEVTSCPTTEKLVVISVIAAILLALAFPSPHPIAGGAALIASALLAFRMRRWRTAKTLSQPILWVLHLGHIWLVVGFALMGVAGLGGPIDESAALHALTAGAMGTMMLAMMTRAALGHTGRKMLATPPIVAAYVLVSLGTVLRVLAPFGEASISGSLISAGAVMWMLAFALFSAVFWPIVTQPRQQ